MIGIRIFRIVSVAEAISFLLLLGVAMPLKYIFDYPLAVKYTGWAHGMLFMSYLVCAYWIGDILKWKWHRYLFAFIAALLPFGPFVFDRTVKKDLEISKR